MNQIIRNSLNIFKSYKVRTLLTIIGIIIAITVYLVINVYGDAVTATFSEMYKDFDSHSVLIRGGVAADDLKKIENLYEGARFSKFYDPMGGTIHTADSNFDVDVKVNIINVIQYDFYDYPIPSIDLDDSIETTRLIYGRTFNNDDRILKRNVIIIHEGFAKLIFGDTNPLGQYVITNSITYASYINDNAKLMVVGVLADTPDVLRTLDMFNKHYENNNDKDLPSIPFYIPCRDTINLDSPSDLIITFREANKKAIESAYLTLTSQFNCRKVYTRDSVFAEIADYTKEVVEIVNLIVLVMLFTTGISLSIILTFSFKERLPEIGIKKALGGSDGQILFQFFLENVFLGLIGAISGLMVGIFLLTTTAPFLLQTPVSTILGFITWDRIIAPLIIAVGVTTAFGYMPSLWGVKQSIVSVLRYE
jgi:putative ABC transport system permease protein